MGQNQLSKRFFVLMSLLLLVLGIVGIDRLRSRPDVDFHYRDGSGNVVVTGLRSSDSPYQAGIRVGDQLVGLDDRRFGSAAELEFLIDNGKPGDSVALAVRREGELLEFPVLLLRRYDTRFIILHLVVGLLFWGIGCFVYLCKPTYLAARVFGWGTVIIAVSIMLNWPGHPYQTTAVGYLLPAAYCLLYPLVPSYILYFALLFPLPKRALARFSALPAVLFFPSLVLIVSYEANYLPAIHALSPTLFAAYHHIYRLFQGFFILYFFLSIAALIHAYHSAKTREAQKKVQWIFWGITVGGVPFILLWTIPQLLISRPLIPEEITYLFMMAVPFSIAFSIVKYHALDIDLVINRSVVYTIVTGVVIGVYLLIVGSVGFLVPAGSLRAGTTISIVATLIAAVLFTPIRNRVQRLVDKTFFKFKYTYGMVIRSVAESFLAAHDKDSVINEMIEGITTAIPMMKIAVLGRDNSDHAYVVIGSRGVPDGEHEHFRIPRTSPMVSQTTCAPLPYVRSGRARLDRARELTDDLIPKTSGILLVIPIVLQEQLIGFLAAGGKRSGARYTGEDVDLLQGVAQEGFMTLERLRYQEGMILERTQRERAEELSRLKSEFVSHVSHELRTPLASIRWSAENLLDGIPEQPSPRIRQYLLGIYDNSQRLATMIENLLDLTRIEAGRIEVNLERMVLLHEIERAVSLLKPLAEMKSIIIDVAISETLSVQADRNHLQAILINLLDNAVKFSSKESSVTVGARTVPGSQGHPGTVAVAILDNGIGIPEEKLPSIFDRFQRARGEEDKKEKGLGLGLHIVRQLVELQGGSITVESASGVGSTFTVWLPGGTEATS
jgi:signal transduction histidine kinase